jgi:hypothetical protein
MSNFPQFTSVPHVVAMKLTTANPNRDGTGVFGDVSFDAADNGSRVDQAIIKAAGATTAGMVRLFLVNGAKVVLQTEIIVDAVTPTPTNKSFETIVSFPDGLIVPKGFSFKASTEKGEAINVTLYGGDF